MATAREQLARPLLLSADMMADGWMMKPTKVLFLLPGGRAAEAAWPLARRGCLTRATEDGDEAARWLAEGRWHAVVLDLDLPGFDVLGLVATLRRSERTRDVTVVARVDSASEAVATLAFESGCDRLIAGHLSDAQLAREIDRCLAARPSRIPGPPPAPPTQALSAEG